MNNTTLKNQLLETKKSLEKEIETKQQELSELTSKLTKIDDMIAQLNSLIKAEKDLNKDFTILVSLVADFYQLWNEQYIINWQDLLNKISIKYNINSSN